MFGRRILAAAAFVAAASAQLSITQPSPSLWWGTSQNPNSTLYPSDFLFSVLR